MLLYVWCCTTLSGEGRAVSLHKIVGIHLQTGCIVKLSATLHCLAHLCYEDSLDNVLSHPSPVSIFGLTIVSFIGIYLIIDMCYWINNYIYHFTDCLFAIRFCRLLLLQYDSGLTFGFVFHLFYNSSPLPTQWQPHRSTRILSRNLWGRSLWLTLPV